MSDRDAARDAADRRIIEAIFSPPADDLLVCGHCLDPSVAASNSICPGCGAAVVATPGLDSVVTDPSWERYIAAGQSRGLIRSNGVWTLVEPVTDDPAAEVGQLATDAFLSGPAQ